MRVPSTINVVIASARGRPRFKSRPNSGETPIAAVGVNGDREEAGLKSIAPAPLPQFHGYIDGSGTGGLVEVPDSIPSLPTSLVSRLGV